MAALTLTTEAYRDKVLGGWHGKSAGLTLGAPQRGQRVPGRNNYYSPVPGQPVAGLALDFPLVWLDTLETAGPAIAPEDLAVAWLEHLDYQQDEFAYAAQNLRRGVPPPASGAHSNWFRHSSGGLVRADLWAMVAPGAPQVAAAYAYHDSKLDHSEDGIWATMFLAALGSAAFFLTDPLTLLTIGLAMIPRTCRTARAVKTGLAAAQRAASWLEARESILNEVGHQNYTDVAQNIGFITLGLFYGGRDFGPALCSAVNCGYDSETVGGALGAILGIQRGKSGIPDDWLRPIGDLVIPGHGLRDFEAPMTLTEVGDRTVAIGLKIAADRIPDIEIADEQVLSSRTPPAPPVPTSTGVDALASPALANAGASTPTSEGATPPADAVSPAIVESPPTAAGDTPAMGVPNAETAFVPGTDAPRDAVPADAPTAQAASDADRSPEPATLPNGEPAVPYVTPQLPDAAPAPDPLPPMLPTNTELPEPNPLPVSSTDGPGVLSPQPVSRAAPAVTPQPHAPEAPAPLQGVAAMAPIAPDPTNAIAWAESTRVKPLLVTPPNAFFSMAGPLEVMMDTGESPTIGFGQIKTVSFVVINHGEAPFSGRIALLAPPGWQIGEPQNIGQRQYIAAHNGTLRADYSIRVNENQGRVDIANTLVLKFAPDSGSDPAEAEFLLLGAACWRTVGLFANFDGEGFDRSYLPEDRPGLNESYLSRNMQMVTWEKRIFPELTLDLEAQLFKGSSGVCYGYTVLRSPTARDARLVANTNSGVKIWLRGQLALRRFNRDVFRPQLGSGPWAVDVALQAGDNPVMVKWVRGSEPFQFSLTVSDRYGRGLPEVGNTSW